MKLRVTDLDDAIVHFDIVSTARSISARWRSGEIRVVVPPGTFTVHAVEKLVAMKERIMASRPALTFHDGQQIDFDGFTVSIRRQSLKPTLITLTGAAFTPVISVGTKLDFNDMHVTQLISRLMCVVAKNIAPDLLFPRAAELSASLGVTPARWKISSGHHTLGTCSRKGEISLSSIVVFLTPELRDYIIYHELAHITEMNHSPRFHALCDQYCGGRERELIKKLKAFKWPILRQ